jgi:hypothetical protein
MEMARVLQGVVLLAVFAAAVWIVVSAVDGWEDWVVLGVFVMTAIGAGMAVHHRRYTVKRRDFVKRH